MASNTYPHLSPENAVLLANQILATIGKETPSAYNVSQGQLTSLQSASSGLSSKNAAVVAAKAAYHAAVTARDEQDATTKEAISSIAGTVYSTKTVTAEMIRALGLQPRATTRTKIVPTTPTDLTAKVQPNSAISLNWKRNGNPNGVVFLVEAQTAGGAWAFVQDTTAAKITVSGFEAGTVTSFRILASKNGITALPSPVAIVYPSVAPSTPVLRLAA